MQLRIQSLLRNENTSMSFQVTDYAEVTDNLVGTVVTIPDTIAVHDLSGGDIGSPTKTICRLDDLGAKSLEPECPQTGSNSLLR